MKWDVLSYTAGRSYVHSSCAHQQLRLNTYVKHQRLALTDHTCLHSPVWQVAWQGILCEVCHDMVHHTTGSRKLTIVLAMQLAKLVNADKYDLSGLICDA